MIANITTTYCETYIIFIDIHCEELFTVIKIQKKEDFNCIVLFPLDNIWKKAEANIILYVEAKCFMS